MANPILPHPNMDFTPLDVLTATELDQMVANIQYLTNFCRGLADGNNLDNGSVLPSKLKLDSLPQSSTNRSGHFQIGKLLLQWGRNSARISSGVPAEVATTVTFSKSFSYQPSVLIQPEDISGVCGEFSVLANVTPQNFVAIVGRTLHGGENTTVNFGWLAIGTTNT